MSVAVSHNASAEAAAPGGGALSVEGLRLSYPDQRGDARQVVDIDAWQLPAGAIAGITGPSGSGKTSLLYLLCGIEPVRAGTVRWDAVTITELSERQRDAWRRRHVGFVFQEFHLVPGLSPLDNVLLSAWFDHTRAPEALRRRGQALLERVGVPTARRDIGTMSRGEQQRVALARALLRAPRILLADEPTASLDAASGTAVIDLLTDIAEESAATLLVVTHDPRFLERLTTVYWLQDGRLTLRA